MTILLLLGFTSSVYADTPTVADTKIKETKPEKKEIKKIKPEKKADIKKLLILLELDKTADKIWKQLDVKLKLAYTLSGGNKNDKEMYEKYTSKIAEEFKKGMEWKVLEEDFTQLYAELYNEQEIKAMIAYYETQAGKKQIEQAEKTTKETMKIVQKYMLPLMPKFQTSAQEMQQKLKKISDKIEEEAKAKAKEEAKEKAKTEQKKPTEQ